ncbi:MAG: hypothetical protein JNL64_01205 [Blastocatellia bacterium]|nr:hypothetical protein [Blastocatellia bacterium]
MQTLEICIPARLGTFLWRFSRRFTLTVEINRDTAFGQAKRSTETQRFRPRETRRGQQERRERQERSGQCGQPERGLPARTLRLVKHAADSRNDANGKNARDSSDSRNAADGKNARDSADKEKGCLFRQPQCLFKGNSAN